MTSLRTLAWFMAIGSATLLSGQATMLSAIDGSPGSRFGTGVASLGDVDGDLVPDFAVTSLSTSAGWWWHSPELTLFSGQDGSPVWMSSTQDGQLPMFLGTVHGAHLEAMKDVDGDGVKDLLLSNVIGISGSHTPGPTTAMLVSGATGTLLWSMTGYLGYPTHVALSSLPDISLDGVPEIAVGVQGGRRIDVLSGASRERILTCLPPPGVVFLNGLSATRDHDLDGVPDLVASASGSPLNNLGIMGVVFSSATGAALRLIWNPVPWSIGATAIVTGDDYDGDQFEDLLFGVMSASPDGAVAVISGRTLAPLYTWTGTSSTWTRYGHRIKAIPDVNGDGVGDVAIGAPGGFYDSPFINLIDGLIEVRSGATGSRLFQVRGSRLGGTQLGYNYDVLGDLTGNGSAELVVGMPGFQNGSGHVPGRVAIISLGDGLGACASATVGADFGPAFPPLRINGSTGGTTRRVPVAAGSPMSLEVLWPSSHLQPPRFALWARLGPPEPTTSFATPLFDLCFAPPAFAGPFEPVITLYDGFSGDASLPLGPPPSAVSFTAPQSSLTLQVCGVMEAPGGVQNGLERMNAVLIDVR